MKILQVVTYISPDGAYGGPVRVAINQAKALRDMGHEVTIAASAGGFKNALPHDYDGFPVKLFPARRVLPGTGFAGFISPQMLMWMLKALKETDIVHVHLARDLVTLPAAVMAIMAQKGLILQPHGMIDPSEKILARILDRLLTIPVMQTADKIYYLREEEKRELEEVAGDDIARHFLPNGITTPEHKAIEQEAGPLTSPEVLFMARVHPQKRPMEMVRCALELTARWPTTKFTLVGPDEGQGPVVTRALSKSIHHNQTVWEGGLSPQDTLARMKKASIYVLPSLDETFPMAVLEAMSLGIPVVITNTCGLADAVATADAGIVYDGTQKELVRAVEWLLGHPKERTAKGARGRKIIQEMYDIREIALKLSHDYVQCRK